MFSIFSKISFQFIKYQNILHFTPKISIIFPLKSNLKICNNYQNTNKFNFSTISLPTFNKYGLNTDLLTSLEQQEIHTPSPIQQLAIPSLLKQSHDHYYLAAQTGTGKTLAYLLPILQLIKAQEKDNEKNTIPNRPFAFIIVPSKELVEQILSICKTYIHFIKLKAGGLGLSLNYVQERKMLDDGVDILITTIDRLENHRKKNNVYLSKAMFLVIDEADTLIDSGFKDIIADYIKISLKNQIRTIFVSATFTSPLSKLFDENFGRNSVSLKKIIEKNTHMNLSNLHHEFIHIKDLDKQTPLIKILKEYEKKIKQTKGATLIFCNSIPSCQSLEYKLKQEGFDCISLHGDIPKNVRIQNFQRFLHREINIMISTDLGSRGLDFPFLNHVINFDFPKTTSDYLHRAGRAGRAGRKGFVSNLYHNKDNQVISELKSSNETGEPLQIKASAFSLKNKETLKTKGENKQNDLIKANISKDIPKSYIDFKNEWSKSKEKKQGERVKGWLKEKNLDRSEIKELKKEKNKHNKFMRNKLGKKMKSIKFRIRNINRRISRKRITKSKSEDKK